MHYLPVVTKFNCFGHEQSGAFARMFMPNTTCCHSISGSGSSAPEKVCRHTWDTLHPLGRQGINEAHASCYLCPDEHCASRINRVSIYLLQPPPGVFPPALFLRQPLQYVREYQRYGLRPNHRRLPVPSERTLNTQGSPGWSRSRGTVRWNNPN